MVITTSLFLHSPPIINPISLSTRKCSLRHFVRHHNVHPNVASFNKLFSVSPSPHFFKCSYSSNTSSLPEFENPVTKTFTSVKEALKDSKLTPFDVCKWTGVFCVVIAAIKWAVGVFLNPFFWMYFSWTWLFWPYFLAIALGVYGIYCQRKHSVREANVFEQLVIVTSAFTWLTLVPPAHFNGYLQGWPCVFFFVYHYFFFFNVSVRKRLYGDYYARDHDPKWDVKTSSFSRLLFCVGVMVGHWLAAFEGPELHLTPGGWSNVGILVLIMTTLFMQYHSTLYLAKYSEKVVVPTSVVQFGPYRWVRHPIYASVMLLFATYCIALRALLSFLFVVAICVVYFEQKVKLEEHLMIETFGERYTEYMNKVCRKVVIGYYWTPLLQDVGNGWVITNVATQLYTV
ncbi:hypothetical protein IFM89_000149 [Coptis chinensis]|uniref:Protein-S-isoprenylcysteine O-methyltransferase n=1 Tax=Coptis chinensis TaxID=261450 RepID=A0A835H5A2_9MAGN|nr:hypothetical protein IFM89_000149 [Coptis chinensis]